jgi:cell division transport system permease protein
MFFAPLLFLLQECWLNIRRQGMLVVTCVSTSAIAMTILGVFVLLAWQVHSIAAAIPRQFEVHAFVQTSTSRADAELLAAQIRRMPGVAKVNLVPKEQAWEQFQKHYAAPQDLDGMENPLPDKIEISAASPEQTLQVARQVRELPKIEQVKGGEEVLQRVLAIANGIRIGGITLALLLALGTTAIIGNAIKITLFARRRDIRVMQLVGATNGFIRLPFVLEGMLEGGLGGAIACLILGAALRYFTVNVIPNVTLVKEFQLSLDPRLFCASLVMSGVLFGIIGSLLSLRRFLRLA